MIGFATTVMLNLPMTAGMGSIVSAASVRNTTKTTKTTKGLTPFGKRIG